MPLIQVAISTLDLEATTTWYREIFGFLPTGEMFGATGPEVAAFMGLPAVNCDLQWLVDTSDLFQLEFTRFHEPASNPGTRRPDDAGWSLVGIYVEDLDAVLARLREAGAPVGPVLGDGVARRVCTRDPDGVWLELRERVPGVPTPRPIREAPVTTAFVRAVVTDLARAREFFCDALGLRDTGATLHTSADEALWGSEPADTRSCVLSADGSHDTVVVELVQYLTRVPRPLPENYQLSDQGLLNVAFGSREPEDYDTVMDQVRLGGFRMQGELAVGSARGRFLVGADDLSVETITIPEAEIERALGFTPSAPTRSSVRPEETVAQ
jgi:catechol 2,3-dioxygenase-like lactoylglutathione lyase family enzyme